MNDNFTNTHDELDALLTQAVENTNPSQHFTAELEQKLRQVHETRPKRGQFYFTRKQIFSTAAWTAALVAFAFVMNWAVKSIAPVPTSMPAANETSTPSHVTTPTRAAIETQATPLPNGESYDWRDTKLYLNTVLPDAPTQANIYLLKEGEPATVEQAQALAAQFGIQGQVYTSQNLGTGATELFITDGKQSLLVSTDRFFTYTADMSKAINFLRQSNHPNAETNINDFLASHGFDFPHKVSKGELFGGYQVEPLSPDGFPMRYEFFSSRPIRITLDENGQVLQLEADLMEYEPIGTQAYDIITAEEALQKMMDDTVTAGKIESAVSGSFETKQWIREYPENETITIYGYASSVPALDPTQPAFIQIDGFTVTGNSSGMEVLETNTFVEATGQFITENGIEKFNIESWQISGPIQDGLTGTLTSENGQVIFQTEGGERLIVQPELPADVPLPLENAFVVGTRRDDTYNWTLIDNRMSLGGGGGGGGGGQGFYKLNLSGTSVIFPPAAPTPGANDGSYTVQAGDTLASIAMNFGVSISELAQVNNLSNENIIYIDQVLIIPGVQTEQKTTIANLRGLLSIIIHKTADGSEVTEYNIVGSDENNTYFYNRLEGPDLEQLIAYHGLPISVSGTARVENNLTIIDVESYEIPYPNLQFQIVRGTQEVNEINGQYATIFTIEGGGSYVELMSTSNHVNDTVVGIQGETIQQEVLIVPDEILYGMPVVRVYQSAIIDSNASQMQIMGNQPMMIDDTQVPAFPTEAYTSPALTIEKVELMYFVSNPHWTVNQTGGSTPYIQPVWRFYGHYENGGEFDIIIQALKQEYLLPELEPHVQGG